MGSYALVFIIPFYKQDWYIAIDVVKPFGNFLFNFGLFYDIFVALFGMSQR